MGPSEQYDDSGKPHVSGVEYVDSVDVVDKPLTSVWTSLITVDHSVSLTQAFIRPLILLACPDVLFAIFVYGTSLASQIILM